MKRIISIFLLITTIIACKADVVSHPDREQHFALRRLVRYINGNFKMAGKTCEVEIVSEESVPPGEPRVEILRRKHRIYINPLDDWQRDEGFCRKLIHLLLRAKSGCSAANLSDLPDWFVCGIAEVAREQTASARLIRNQHTFTLLDILSESGCFGNPAAILDADMKTLSWAEKMLFAEYSKLLMLTLEKERAFSRFTVMLGDDAVIDRQKFNDTAKKLLNNFDSEFISPAYRRIMWSDLVPPPEKFTLMCLEKALVSDVPELDKEGLPTGKLLKVRLEDFSLLADRSDFLFICRRAVSGLHTVSVGESRRVRSLLADLRYLLEAEINYQTGRRSSVERSAKPTDPRVRKSGKPGAIQPSNNKKQSANKQKADADFDSLMRNSSDSRFKESMREFYKNNVIDKNADSSSVFTGRIGRMFSSETKLDGRKAALYISEIKTALSERAALRGYLAKELSAVTPIHDLIKFRKGVIYDADSRHTLWLERISKELY